MSTKRVLFLLMVFMALAFFAACNRSTEVSVVNTPAATATDVPTAVPTATATLTATPSPTAVLSPTPSPTPTLAPTPAFPEITNLTLALAYEPESLEPLSPQKHFPLGVGYIAVVLDYNAAENSQLDWIIYDENNQVKESGMVSLNHNQQREAFIMRPNQGLDEGAYHLEILAQEKSLLSQPFEVYWAPTIWPISIGTHYNDGGDIANSQYQFSFGTESLVATFPTINFSVNDVILVEWFLDGEKVGEHRYVWDNAEWSTGIHGNKIDNQVEVGKGLRVGHYEVVVSVNDAPKQCAAFEILPAASTLDQSTYIPCQQYQVVADETPSSGDNWDRYEPRTFAELIALTKDLLPSELSEPKAVYLEMGPEYQYPSSIKVIFTGEIRGVAAQKLTWITTWMRAFAPALSAEEVKVIFGREALFTEGSESYWVPVQQVLLDEMEQDMEPGQEVELLLLWIGGAADEAGVVERIFLVNAYR